MLLFSSKRAVIAFMQLCVISSLVCTSISTAITQRSRRRWIPITMTLGAITGTDAAASKGVFIPTLKNVPYRINQVVSDKSRIDAVRFRHIEVATEALAIQCKSMIVNGETEFGDLASKVSLCMTTKEHGGDVGWVNTTSTATDSVFPAELVNAALFLNKGDVVIVSAQSKAERTEDATTSWHLLQLLDVNTALNPTLKKRRRDSYKSTKGIKNDETDPNNEDDESKVNYTYSIETMGCQMNSADSERMEAQLLDLGYSKATDPARASVVVLNTCSIRDHAEQKVYSYLGPHALRKRKGEGGWRWHLLPLPHPSLTPFHPHILISTSPHALTLPSPPSSCLPHLTPLNLSCRPQTPPTHTCHP